MFNFEQDVDDLHPSYVTGASAGECAEGREPLIVDWDELERRRWASAYSI